VLNDTDDWPVPCPDCGQVTPKQIGWLKLAVNITCDHCGITRRYHNDGFIQTVENLKKTIDTVPRTSIFTEKFSQFSHESPK
jgi:hypothetical protein